jgi:hypothetical protein
VFANALKNENYDNGNFAYKCRGAYMNDTEFGSLIQPSHSRKPSSYDHGDRLRTTLIKMTPMVRLYLQVLLQMEEKSQGQPIEECGAVRFDH